MDKLNFKRITLVLFLVIGAILALLVASRTLFVSPERALSEFFERQVKEDQLMDPLIIAGGKIVPLLVSRVTDKNMPRRRYAILALGNIGDRSALPVLQGIVRDPAEVEHFRCDALKSIALIAREQALELAQQQQGSMAACVESADGARRSYLAAALAIY